VTLDRPCPPSLAKTITDCLLGEREHEMPSGRRTYTYFSSMTMRGALDELNEVYEMNEGQRLRALMRRMGEDVA
jgi:hypothetical protein